MPEALYEAFVKISADTLGFTEQVKTAVASATDIGAPVRINAEVNPASVAGIKESIGKAATIDSTRLGQSGLAAVERARPTLIETGRQMGEHIGAGFHERFGEKIKGTLESIGKIGFGIAAFAGAEEFFKGGIENAESLGREVDILRTKLGSLTDATVASSAAAAGAVGANRFQGLKATTDFITILQQQGLTNQQAIDKAAILTKVAGSVATQSGEDFPTAAHQILGVIQTGRGGEIAKYLGKFTPKDVENEARKLGLGTEQDKSQQTQDATLAVQAAQANLDKVAAGKTATPEEQLKLTNDRTIAEDNLTRAKERAAAGKGSPQAVLAAENALAAVRKKQQDANHPADDLKLAEAKQKLVDAQDRLNKSTAEGTLTLSDEDRTRATTQLLIDRAAQLPEPIVTGSTKIKNALDNIATSLAAPLVPKLDQFAGFLTDHQAEIVKQIQDAFDIIGPIVHAAGEVFKFIVDHKTVFFDVALALGSIKLGKGVYDELVKFQGLYDSIFHPKGGSSPATALKTAAVTITADVVNVNGKLSGGGGGSGGSGPGGTLTKEEQAAEDAKHPGSRDRTALGIPPGGSEPIPAEEPKPKSSALGLLGGPELAAAAYIASSYGGSKDTRTGFTFGIPFTDIHAPTDYNYTNAGGSPTSGDSATLGGKTGKHQYDSKGNLIFVPDDGGPSTIVQGPNGPNTGTSGTGGGIVSGITAAFGATGPDSHFGPDIIQQLRDILTELRTQKPNVTNNNVTVNTTTQAAINDIATDVQRGLYLSQKGVRGIGAAVNYPGDGRPGGPK